MRMLAAVVPLEMHDVGMISANRIYVQRRNGPGKTLNDVGRSYQRFAIGRMLTLWMLETGLDPNAECMLELVFYLPRIYNEGWPGKAATRHKKIDVTNLVKFFQDCVVKASGIDDANHMDIVLRKRQDALRPRVEVLLMVQDESE